MRPLLLSSAQALAIDPGAARRPNALLMAQHLLADLQPKVMHLLGKAARPSFLATAQPAQVPPGLEGVSAAQLLELLQPLLPAWRQLVDCAVECLREPAEDGTAALLDGGRTAAGAGWCLEHGACVQHGVTCNLGLLKMAPGHKCLHRSPCLGNSWACCAAMYPGVSAIFGNM
jgi:hypothetical protein